MSAAAISFVVFLLGFVAVGVLSVLRARGTTSDYYVASKGVKPWLAALSAVATNNSGYMFIGMIGLTYMTGLSSIWLMIGWILGDLTGSYLVWGKLRQVAERDNVDSYPQLLARWQGGDFVKVRRLAALVSLGFLSVYAAAQLKAGGKALHVLFDWEIHTGAIMGAVMVLIYSIVGGIRAAIWTDAAQSFVMIGAMILLMVVGIAEVGGWAPFMTALHQVDPGYMSWFGGQGVLAGGLGIVGWLFAGLGVLGQPHIVIRFMAIDDPDHIRQTRRWYYGWFTAFYSATIVVGLLTRLLLPEIDGFDAELALPTLAQQMLPGVLVGLILAGLFAATMSTADSLVLACSGAVTQDLLAEQRNTVIRAKLATATIVGLALIVAVSDTQTVFRLVLDAWGVLGACFVPLLLLYAFGRSIHESQALVIMGTGLAVFILWRQMGMAEFVYGIFPAIATASVLGIVLTAQSSRENS